MRVKGGKVQTRKRNKWLNRAKGYFGAKSKQYRTAKAAVMKSALYAYRDRRQRRRDMRRLWIIRVNAAVRLHDLSYSKFIHGLKLAGVIIDRKMLSELAIHDPAAFGAVVELAKQALSA